jgi:leukotriene-A4 hydrolase
MVEAVQAHRKDPHTVANFESFVTKDIQLEWKVDFESKSVSGFVILNLERVGGDNQVHLDASELKIGHVSLDGSPLKFTYDPKATQFGECLTIDLPLVQPNYKLKIEYETTDGCTALQWLTPEQTYGKKFPFLFSQSQAIHARTLLPCQDSPMIKATYSGSVSVLEPMTVVMSANIRQSGEPANGYAVVHFEQSTPIPAYLIAIGAGDLKSVQIGPRSAVWCEQEVLEKAAFEFADTEAFIKAAEDIVTPYVWGKYDILLLPPSFPYGGMENPCLTFLTPSLLAGDRSLVNVVAHEIAHSWTGNLVTNSSWVFKIVL